jgi:polyphosphate kinase
VHQQCSIRSWSPTSAWRKLILGSDGCYTRLAADADAFSAHTYFMTNPSLSGRGSAFKRARKTPHLVLKKG